MLRTLALVGVLMGLALPARAELNGVVLGDVGVLKPGGEISLSFNNQQVGESDSSNTVQVRVAPELMYFVVKNFALGGQIILNVTSTTDSDTGLALGLGPRAGFNVRINDKASFFPNGGPTLMFGSGFTTLQLNVRAPLLYHVGNYYIGAGPFVDWDVFSRVEDSDFGRRNVTVGLTTVLGGWFPPAAAPDGAPDPFTPELEESTPESGGEGQPEEETPKEEGEPWV